MRMRFVSRDAACLLCYDGNRLETYADTPAVACALKVDVLVQRSVPLVPAPTAVSVLQVSAIHNLLLVLLAAVLSATTVQEASLPAGMVATLTAAAVFHTCTGCATSETQDPVMYTNLLLLQQVYLLNKGA
jgi:hypothetical protein